MAVIKQRTTQLYGGITFRPRDDTETMSYDLVTPRRYAILTWGVEGETSRNQTSNTKEIEKGLFLFRILINNDDIERYLEQMPEYKKVSKKEQIIVDLYL